MGGLIPLLITRALYPFCSFHEYQYTLDGAPPTIQPGIISCAVDSEEDLLELKGLIEESDLPQLDRLERAVRDFTEAVKRLEEALKKARQLPEGPPQTQKFFSWVRKI